MLKTNKMDISKELLAKVKNENIERSYIDEQGCINIETKWYTYKCDIDTKYKSGYKLKGKGKGKLIGLAISGLVLIVPLIIVLCIGIKESPVYKDIQKQISAVLADKF